VAILGGVADEEISANLGFASLEFISLNISGGL